MLCRFITRVGPSCRFITRAPLALHSESFSHTALWLLKTTPARAFVMAGPLPNCPTLSPQAFSEATDIPAPMGASGNVANNNWINLMHDLYTSNIKVR